MSTYDASTHLFVTIDFLQIPLALCPVLQYNLSVTFDLKAIEVLEMRSKEDILPDCPVATTVSLIGSKWKLLIMRNLLGRPWRFNELQKSIDGISQKALTEALRSMEADGIVRRTVYPEVPPRVEYSLTELGESMRPIIKAMEKWGSAYKEQINYNYPG